MTTPSIHPRLACVALSVAAAAALSACSHASTVTPTADQPSAGATSAAPGPEPSISYAPGASPAPTQTNPIPEPSRRPADQPDPTSDGPLDAKALPNPIAGFTGTPLNPTEGEFNPNGTWVHAVDAASTSFQAIPTCGAVAGTLPRAQHALAGTYRATSGEQGHGMVLQFVNPGDAQRWYDTFVDHLGACPKAGGPTAINDLTRRDGLFTDHRTSAFENANWGEAGRLRGDRVVLIALGGGVDLNRLGQELSAF